MSPPYTPKEFAPLKGLQIRTLDDPRLTERIRVIDRYCFPVKYTESYYSNYVYSCSTVFNQVAFFNGLLVGSVTCRLEQTKDNKYQLYIMTIGVLEAYRHLGIGSRLLQQVLDAVHNETKVPIEAVVLHMQVGSPAMEFYRKFDFEVTDTIVDYYDNLDTRDALLLRRVVPQPRLVLKK